MEDRNIATLVVNKNQNLFVLLRFEKQTKALWVITDISSIVMGHPPFSKISFSSLICTAETKDKFVELTFNVFVYDENKILMKNTRKV